MMTVRRNTPLKSFFEVEIFFFFGTSSLTLLGLKRFCTCSYTKMYKTETLLAIVLLRGANARASESPSGAVRITTSRLNIISGESKKLYEGESGEWSVTLEKIESDLVLRDKETLL